jgi:hypothetical protein
VAELCLGVRDSACSPEVNFRHNPVVGAHGQ